MTRSLLGVVLVAGCGAAATPAASRAHTASGPAHVTIATASAPPRTAVTQRTSVSSAAATPALLVHVDRASDPTRAIEDGVAAEVTRGVRGAIEANDYATAWPGGLPDAAALERRGARAFVVVPTVHEVEVRKRGATASIACRVEIRVSPWNGTDGGERWEVASAATATGQARATTSTRDTAIAAGVRDCLREVATQVATNRIVPFLRNVGRRGE